ncbi:MAG: DUF2341 domain-containing protein, partial [bacterium]|nr:DUF2341 domain-containing protein [bacterium]
MITIDQSNVDADLTDFPLLVKITSDSDISTALSNGYDIRFTSSDGSTLLKYERESWSGGGGTAVTAVIWVKVPAISGTTNTDIYMYYGKADATDGQDVTNVWDSSFKGVWHFKETTGVNNADSTSNVNTGTPTNGPVQATGKIDGSLQFDGVNDSVAISSLAKGQMNIMASVWVKPARLEMGHYNTVFWESTNVSNVFARLVMWIYNDGIVEFGGRIQDDGGFQFRDSVPKLPINTWSHIVGVWNGSSGDISIFINGTQVSTTGTGVAGQIANTNPAGVEIGDDFQGDNMGGIIDEPRISSIARSAEWIKFEYNNMNASNNELTLASQDIVGLVVPTIATPTAQSSSSIRWNFTDNATTETGFKLYDSANNLISTNATADLSYIEETGLSPNTQYSGRYVKAYNAYGESASSAVAESVYTITEPSSTASSTSTSPVTSIK